jgi:ribonuclease HII
VFPIGCSAVRGLRDSKILLPSIRARLAERVRRRVLAFGLGAASAHEIDRYNIRVASAIAMRRAIARLIRRSTLAPYPNGQCRACEAGLRYRIIIDGLPLPEIGYVHEALIDGDARCQSISAAAILAKTVRDRLMQRLADRYPGYGWHTNVGYGTEEHQEALRLHGPTKHHRLTFEPLAQLTLSL